MRPDRRRRRLLAAGAIALLSAVCAVALVAAADAPPGVPGGRAAVFVPPDGAVTWQEGPDGTVVQLEEGVIAGARGLFTLPMPLVELVFPGYAAGEEDAPHWVSFSDTGGRDGVTTRDVRTLTGAGIRQIGVSGGEVDFGFSPGLLVLPADVEEGSAWSSEGAAAVAFLDEDGSPSYGVFDYSAEYSARAPADPALEGRAEPGCLETEAALSFDGDSGSFELSSVDLWCPGRGIVASTGEAGTTLAGAAPRIGAAANAQAPTASWEDAASWTPETVPVVWDDPLWETPEIELTPSIPPVVLDDRLVVDDPGGDILILRPDGDRLVLERMLHPGGGILTLSVADGLLVATTADRRVVAYDADGVRQWARTLPDLVYAPAAAAPDGLVVAGVDGTLRLLDPATGEDRWSAPVSASGLEQVLVAGDVAIAGDQRGGLAAVSLDTGEVRWRDTADEPYADFGVAGDLVVGATGATVELRAPETGDVVAVADTAATIEDLDVSDSAIVATTVAGLVGVDPESGGVVWRDGADAAEGATDGERVLVEGGGTVRLLDEDGRPAATWPVGDESLGAARFLVGAGDGVWVVDSVDGITRIG